MLFGEEIQGRRKDQGRPAAAARLLPPPRTVHKNPPSPTRGCMLVLLL
jgi:hypothetical protein